MKILNIFIDGAARGNPGPSAIGVVLSNKNGDVIKNISKYIGKATNNVAEYTALVFALDEARNIGAEELTINTDSELLAKQLSGEYKVKNSALKELNAKIMRMLSGFSEVKINKIPRNDNKGADKLANKALDANISKIKKKPVTSFILKTKNKNVLDTLF